MLSAKNISVKIGNKTLLNDISLSVKPGELLAVIGPNGAGKSTLLKSLSGELTPANGKVEMNATPIQKWVPAERAQRCAILPQSSSLSFPFSVLDVVLMGRSPHTKAGTAKKDLHIAQLAISTIGIDCLTERIYTTLSGGERQRVHFARILCQIWEAVDTQPRYILLDEPTSALDISRQHECLKIARDFAKHQQVGVLAVLHDLNLAALYADKIAVLQSGKLMACDAPNVVINKALIQRVFDYSVEVYPHPQNSHCPLVISLNQDWNNNTINNKLSEEII